MHVLRFLIAAIALAAAPPPAVVAQLPAKDRIVVLISLDGFPAFAFEDPKLPAPALRRLVREGAMARAMTVVNPAVTWPNHTSLVSGVPPAKHGVLFNGMLIRQGPASPPRIEPWRDKSEMVRATTVYDLAHRAGLTTAQVDWVAIQNAPSITWEFAERPNPRGRIEQEMIAAGALTEKEIEGFAKAPITWRDQVWTQAGVHIIRKHKPNLLLFHLLNLDSTHHRYGARNLASNTGMAFADSRVADILAALRDARMLERSSVLVVSDHGFKTASRSIWPNALLRERGLLRSAGAGIDCDAYVIAEGGTAMVYVTDPAKREALVPKLKDMFTSLEGIQRVIAPEDFAGLGLPHPNDYEQMADLVLAAQDGYNFSGGHDGAAVAGIPVGAAVGSHGYVSTDPDMDAIYVAWGYGIRPGARLDRISNLDVAPTIAELLGLKLEGAGGRPLRELLK